MSTDAAGRPAADTSATLTCWNCAQQLPVGSSACVYCGVVQEPASAALVVAPHGVATAGGAPVPVRAPESASVLGPEFDGQPARAGARVAAFTVDAAAVLIVTAAATLLSRSAVLGVVVLIEAVVLLGVAQARSGASLGNLLLRVRVSRLDAPFSPGIGRSSVRGLIVGVGALAALLGAWVVVASSAWDRSGARRSWADKAAGTAVVAVPRRARADRRSERMPARAPLPRGNDEPPPSPLPTWGVPSGAAAAAGAIAVVDTSAPLTLPEPQPVPRQAPARVSLATGTSTGTATNARPLATGAVPTGLVPVIVTDGGESDAGLLLVFDTGQREQLPIPVTANLGRAPSATEPSDRLISVADPESSVSKTHARLEHSRSGTWITDEGSTNGTELIDEEGHARTVPAQVRTHVEDGERIRLGNRVFTVSVLVGGRS